MADMSEWQGKTGQAWAEEWRRTDRSFADLTQRLLTRVDDVPFRHALDIGCGAGELSLAIARGRRTTMVTGVDVSAALIEVAKERGAHLANAAFACADAARWSAEESSTADLLVSRHGVMFFDNPIATFAHLRAQSTNGSGLLFSCFRDRDDNPFFTEPTRLLADPPAPPSYGVPGPFAFADCAHAAAILDQAGWANIEFERFDFAMMAGAGSDPIEDALAYWKRIGPIARALSEMDADAQRRLQDRIRELAARHCHDGIVALPASAWIVTASNGDGAYF